MADPLSVTGLAIGMVSLGVQVSQGITTYIDALNCRNQDLASVRQQNDSLRNTLQIVETSRSQFERDHQVATAAIRGCLDSCNTELKVLENLVADLTACDRSTTGWSDRIKNKGKKLLYPFSRPKLEQLETRLRNANTALQLALQILGLSISQLGTEKMATLEATSYNLSTGFCAVQSEVSAMSLPLEGIHSTLSRVETRFDSFENLFKQLLVQQPVIDGNLQEITATEATRRLLARPEVLRNFCDAAGVSASPTSSGMRPAMNHRATDFGNTVSTHTEGVLACWCRHRRRLQRKNVVWGSMILSFEAVTEQHLPGCTATQVMIGADRSQKFSLTYTGLRHLLSSAVQLSFATSWGAGAWSLTPNVTYYPSVDLETAPVFRILTLLSRSRFGGALHDVVLWEELALLAVSAILGLFRAKKASPRAVDANNRSLVSHLAGCITMASDRFKRQLPSQAKPSPLLDLLKCLLDNKAPANDYDLSGHTSLSRLFTSTEYCSVTDPLFADAADLILRFNADANVACLSTPHPAASSTIVDRSGQGVISADGTAVILHFLACSTSIAEAYGCGPLSLAILSSNLEQVEHLVRNHPATLAERDLFGHTPLHLAADKPWCLQLLVKAADARLLNQPDTPDQFGMTALETAVYLSGLRCRERVSSRMCHQCRCDECVAIILEAGCAIPVSACLQHMLNHASKRCKLQYIRYMKYRRGQLKQLALDTLPATELERLGLISKGVLDSAAPRVIQRLKDRGSYIPEALAVARNGPLSVYQALSSPRDADLFFRVGFRDTDSWPGCNDDAAELENIPYLRQGLPYLHWLATHGASSCQFKSLETRKEIFVANYTFWKIGEDFQRWSRYWIFNNIRLGTLFDETKFANSCQAPHHDDRIAWTHEVNAAVLAAEIADSCRCKCSPMGCTPLTSLLKPLPGLESYAFRHKRRLSPEHSVLEDTGSAEGSVADDMDSPEGSVVGDTESSEDMHLWMRGSLSKVVTYLTEYLELFGGDLEVRHHTAALRYVIFTTLGIPHSCCNLHYLEYDKTRTPEQVAEIKDEHAYELGLLEELLGEFEAQITEIVQDPSRGIDDVLRFWKRTWVGRMREVLDSLEGDDLMDDEKRGAEEIGVVWERPKPLKPPKLRDNPYRKDTLEHWKYELAKIEAEC